MKCFICHQGSYSEIGELGKHVMGAHGDMLGELIAGFTQVRWAEVPLAKEGL